MSTSTVRCAALFLGIVLICNPSIQAKADEEDPLEIKEVVVSTSRLPGDPVDIHTIPAKITVITAEDIRKTGAQTVQEAIMNATGIIMYNQVGNTFEQTIDLRGFNGNPVPATTVFVDGVRMNQPGFNQINFDLIPFETIDRIEILPGASAIYGKDALGGVINIITRSGTGKRQATAETLFGSYERQRFTGNTSGPIGKLNYYANFSRELEKGYRQDSGARISRFVGRMGYHQTDRTDLSATYTYVKDRLNQAGSLPLSEASVNPRANFTPGDFIDREDNFFRLNGRHAFPFGVSIAGNMFYRRLQEESFIVGQPFLVGGTNSTSRTMSDLESWGGTLQLTHTANPLGFKNSLVLGGEVRWNDFGSTLSATSDFGPFTSRNSTNEEIAGAYLQDTLHLTPQIILSGGVRYDRDEFDFMDGLTPSNNASKVFDRVTPRGGLTLLISPQTSAYFSYSQGFRVPTNQELFALGLFGSNPNLQAVRSNHFEVGLKTKVDPWIDIALAVYQANVRDEIFFSCIVCDFSLGDGQNRNIPRSRRRGFEGTVTVKPNKYVDGVVNYTFTEAQFRSSFVLGSGGTNVQTIEVGDSFPLVPKNRLSVTINVHPTPEWSLSLNGLYVSTQFFQSDESNSRPRLPGYFVMNGRIAYERPVPGGHLSGFFMVNNILDNEYFTSGILAPNRITGGGVEERFVVPAPTITLFGGLSYRFEGFSK